jgi:hypothetical protein
MEPEGSLPYSQESSTGSYPDPDQSSPYHPILSLFKTHFDIIVTCRVARAMKMTGSSLDDWIY